MPQTAQDGTPPDAPRQTSRDVDPARAWGPYQPSERRPWNLARAAHLHRRAGFGASWGELQEALRLGPQATIDQLLRPVGDAAAFNRTCDELEKAATSVEALRTWWLRRMIETPQPLLEKLTLFWHDHFAVSAAGLPDVALAREHIQCLRAGAMGDFRRLVAEVARQPGVLLSLGAQANRKARPNEQLARQVLHRYTVGPDGCSDNDVREAARAMTGWLVIRLKLRYFAREHDDGEKTVLGTTGKLGAEDVVRIAAGHPAAARRVVRRLYRWLLSETDEPDEKLLAPLSEPFARDFDIARLVETTLRSNLFFSGRTLRQRVASGQLTTNGSIGAGSYGEM